MKGNPANRKVSCKVLSLVARVCGLQQGGASQLVETPESGVDNPGGCTRSPRHAGPERERTFRGLKRHGGWETRPPGRCLSPSRVPCSGRMLSHFPPLRSASAPPLLPATRGKAPQLSSRVPPPHPGEGGGAVRKPPEIAPHLMCILAPQRFSGGNRTELSLSFKGVLHSRT